MTYARGMEDVMLAAAAVGGVIAALLGAWWGPPGLGGHQAGPFGGDPAAKESVGRDFPALPMCSTLVNGHLRGKDRMLT